MSVRINHEDEVEELDLPGRRLRWLVNSELLNSQYMSICMIRVAPGENCVRRILTQRAKKRSTS